MVTMCAEGKWMPSSEDLTAKNEIPIDLLRVKWMFFFELMANS